MTYYEDTKKMKVYVKNFLRKNKKIDQKLLKSAVFLEITCPKKAFFDYLETLSDLNLIKFDGNYIIWNEKDDENY